MRKGHSDAATVRTLIETEPVSAPALDPVGVLAVLSLLGVAGFRALKPKGRHPI